MSRFSETLMDHFQAPRHRGRMPEPDVVGISGVPGQGRYLVLYLQVRDGRVTGATYECHGCGVTIACGSALTELVLGRTLEECRQLRGTDLEQALDGIPADKADRSGFAMAALEDALRQLDQRQAPAPKGVDSG